MVGRTPRAWNPPRAGLAFDVSATQRTARSADTWRKLIESDAEERVATFGGPSDAIECARAAIDAVRWIGLDLRAGVHAGEFEIVADTTYRYHAKGGKRVTLPGRPWMALRIRRVAGGTIKRRNGERIYGEG